MSGHQINPLMLSDRCAKRTILPPWQQGPWPGVLSLVAPFWDMAAAGRLLIAKDPLETYSRSYEEESLFGQALPQASVQH